MKLVPILLCCLCFGCIGVKEEPKQPTVQRIEYILKDTADDLELGAKVRMLVEEQNLRRAKADAEEDRHYLEPYIGAAGLVVLLACLQWVYYWAKRKNA